MGEIEGAKQRGCGGVQRDEVVLPGLGLALLSPYELGVGLVCCSSD